MIGGEAVRVAAEDSGLRLDRWFRRHFPDLPHGHLQKLLRTGRIRVDGSRAKAATRLAEGQLIRIPPLEARPAPSPRDPPPVSPEDADDVVRRVLYRDEHVLVLDKPAGLAVQGGSRVRRHLDAMLDALRFGAERPKLVHRLDKDTSGVLVLARGAASASALARAFRAHAMKKLYWAVVVGVPDPAAGRIALPLAKVAGTRRELVCLDLEGGLPAETVYRVVERAGREAAWLELKPLTGRTHQLRVHCAAIGTPILGDGKYGGSRAFPGREWSGARLHLHARALILPHPAGGTLHAEAPLPREMAATWRFFGFSPAAAAEARRLPAGDGRAEDS